MNLEAVSLFNYESKDYPSLGDRELKYIFFFATVYLCEFLTLEVLKQDIF